MARQFAQVTLKVLSPLHIGSGRAGILAKSHAFVPAHVMSYALACAVGKTQGATDKKFNEALEIIKSTVWCGHFFLQNPDDKQKVLLPKRDKELIEPRFFIATNHVTLRPEDRSSVDGALFEVEKISPFVLNTPKKQATYLVGGVWIEDEQLFGKSLQQWFDLLLLGGELKTGCGRVTVENWENQAVSYANLGQVTQTGLCVKKGEHLAGVALDGVHGVARLPWVGRLYDEKQGFGRKLSTAAFVYTDGNVTEDACFLPSQAEMGFGCWKKC